MMMNNIRTLPFLHHSGLPGVTVLLLSGGTRAGQKQEVLVVVQPNVSIPLHRHAAHATMVLVAGSTEVLSERDDINGTLVRCGSIVEFEANVAHGFSASPTGFTFISRNGGIVDTNEKDWDMEWG